MGKTIVVERNSISAALFDILMVLMTIHCASDKQNLVLSAQNDVLRGIIPKQPLKYLKIEICEVYSCFWNKYVKIDWNVIVDNFCIFVYKAFKSFFGVIVREHILKLLRNQIWAYFGAFYCTFDWEFFACSKNLLF